jgi:phosphatidate cytidylyltransferase
LDKVLRQRAVTALIFVSIVVATLLSGKLGTTIFLALVLMLTTYEISKMSVKKGVIARFSATVNLFILVLCMYTIKGEVYFYISLSAILLHLVFSYFVFKSKISELTFSTKYLWLAYPLLAFLSFIPILQSIDKANFLLLILLLLIWVCDTAAYLVGRKLGKRKLFERVSPKKTWEGAYGSLIFTPLLAMLVPLIFVDVFDLTSIDWAIIGVGVAILGTMGDLYQSQIKRIFEVKDSGKIMPGHGGIWDRFDSFVFLLPFYSFFILLIEKN